MLHFLIAGALAVAGKPAVPSAIAFWDARHGVASFDVSAGWTADGGRTWRGVPLARIVTLVAVARTREAWATVSARGVTCSGIPVQCRMRLVHSSDGGRTWSSASAGLLGPTFADRRNGWAFRPTNDIDYGRLVATRDGGRSWRRAADPCPRARAMGKIASRASRRRGWILCLSQPGTGQQLKVLFETRDSGRSWHMVTKDGIAGGITSSGYPLGLDFLPNGLGIVWESRGSTYVTRDGGRTWAPIELTSPDVVEISSASLVSTRLAFAIVRNGRTHRIELRRSRDGLRTWNIVRSWPWR